MCIRDSIVTVLVCAVSVVVIGAVVAGVVVGLTSMSVSDEDGAGTVPTLTPSSSSAPSGAPSVFPSSVPLEQLLDDLYADVALYPDVPRGGPGTAQFEALRFLVEEDPNLESYDTQQLTQRYALLVMIASVAPDAPRSELEQLGWFTERDECGTWIGVRCTDRQVTTVGFLSFGDLISGTLPAEVGLLSNLSECC